MDCFEEMEKRCKPLWRSGWLLGKQDNLRGITREGEYRKERKENFRERREIEMRGFPRDSWEEKEILRELSIL